MPRRPASSLQPPASRPRGAPKGNLNALKSGKRSRQLKRLVVALMADPATRRVLLALRKMDQRRVAQLQEALNHYALLLGKPSRERSIRSVRPRAILGTPAFQETNTIPPSASGGVPLASPPSTLAPAARYNAAVTRTILFDVDGTLLYSGGAGSLAMRRAFHQLYGIEDGFRRIEFSGRTDPAILRNAMTQHGLLPPSAAGFEGELARFQESYYPLLEQALHEAEGGRTMPGVPELLAELAARDGPRLGLATGNFRKSALMKLRHFGLDCYLGEGGFSDDAEDRGELVGIAIQRLAGSPPAGPKSVWVIGDTPLDVDAAHANGARALAVATGPISVEELRAAGADLTLTDLSDTQGVLTSLLE